MSTRPHRAVQPKLLSTNPLPAERIVSSRR
jgi:hypothetical protein